MDFNIAFLDPNGFPGEQFGLNQTTDVIQKSLSACGHTTRISLNQLHKNAVNIIFDNYFTPEMIEFIFKVRHEQNLKIGLYCGELYIDKNIPYAWDGLVDNKKDPSELSRKLNERIEAIYYLASHLDFCWSALERTALEFKKYNPVSFFFPNGHTQRLDPAYRQAIKDIDVIFVGTATDHRRHWISAIVNSGVAIRAFGRGFSEGYLPGALFGSYLDRSKIALNLTFANKIDPITNADMRFASNDRLLQYLERDICVVSEHIPFDNPYAKFMVNGAPHELGKICFDLLASGAWEKYGTDLAAKFRREFAAKDILSPIIDQTLAALFPN